MPPPSRSKIPLGEKVNADWPVAASTPGNRGGVGTCGSGCAPTLERSPLASSAPTSAIVATFCRLPPRTNSKI